MKKIILAMATVIILAGGFLLWQKQNQKLDNQKQTPTKKEDSSTANKLPDVINTTGLPLSLPKGFGISIFAESLPGARVMALDALGNMWVSQTKEGKISRLEIKDGKVVLQKEILKNLKNPHGLAFDPDNKNILYIAEETQISKLDISNLSSLSNKALQKVTELSKGGKHFTRTLGFGPDPSRLGEASRAEADDKLYVSVGSTCNVCVEYDPAYASIFFMNKDGSDFRPFAKGLRNTVAFAWHPLTKELWGVDNGRDNLGDDLPPDEINIIKEDQDYGWPYCYGKNIHDTDFDKNTYIRNPCQEPYTMPAYIDLPAHSAPLGLAFVPLAVSWPSEYRNSLLVAMHGSLDLKDGTGYKLMLVKLDRSGKFLSTEDFISGFLSADKKQVFGRPVQIVFDAQGNLYISDDKAGQIYKVEYRGN